MAIRLESDKLFVDVLPENGGDILSIIDRASGVDLLWKAPWGTKLEADAASTSGDRWLAGAWGGWQLLLPNTGDEAQEAGQRWGFHGEAGLREWTVKAATIADLDLAVELETAPLDVRRAYRVRGPGLSVETTVRNRSTEPVEFLWGEHPTFGEAFAAGATLEIGAGTVAVERAEDVGLVAGDRVTWPGRAELGDRSLDRLPTGSPGRFLFAFLDDLSEGTYRVSNARLGLSAIVSWPLEVFPCVWLWEEIRATSAAPWNGEAYAVGIEPQTAYPALGMTELRRRGTHGLSLQPGESMTATVTVNVEHVDAHA
jgi:galactose mutarotase-like enzyme